MDLKKLIAMLLVVILLASMICGCEEEKEAVPSETTLQAREPETATQGVETEDLQETAAETEADVACFGAYGSVCNERLTEYGTGSIGTAQSHSKGKYLSGLSVVRLMDFDADGTEELLLIYMTGFDDTWGWSGCYEIWTYKNGEAIQAIASEDFSSGQSGQQELEYLEQDGKIRLIRPIDHSYEMEHPEFRIEAWALNGSIFEQETVVAWKGDGINGKDGNYYYLNGEEISKDQYEVECDKLYNPSVDCLTLYSDFAYEPDEIEKTMEDMLQETETVLNRLGIQSREKASGEFSEKEIYEIAERCIQSGTAVSHTTFYYEGKLFYKVCIMVSYGTGVASDFICIDSKTGDCYAGYSSDTEPGGLIYRFEDLPEKKS